MHRFDRPCMMSRPHARRVTWHWNRSRSPRSSKSLRSGSTGPGSMSEHTAFTGAKATIEALVGGKHSAWDGYIVGENLALEPNRRILQSWRSKEFPLDSEDSTLEVVLTP